MKILIHTPISNRAWVLPEWWNLLTSQLKWRGGFEATMLFDLNDSQDETEYVLHELARHPKGFQAVSVNHRAWTPLHLPDHVWSPERYERMRIMRNGALFEAKTGGYDYLFSLDSDVMLRDPDTLCHLTVLHVPVIAGVFTAQWGNAFAEAIPNVWERGQNEMSDGFKHNMPSAQSHVRVGGLGACTLIAREVWEKGVSYDPVYNLPSNYRGEDRDFCVRAAVAGFELLACAHKSIDHLDKPKIKSEVTQ